MQGQPEVNAREYIPEQVSSGAKEKPTRKSSNDQDQKCGIVLLIS